LFRLKKNTGALGRPANVTHYADRRMILTTCAVCANPLAHDAPAHCVNCQTRYCSDRCLRYHSHRGGHDDACDEIASGGGAERYHADKKYKEAVATAVEACAEDTKDQTCYICMEGAAEEGLVRMCACRGAAGFVHVSCLAEQAKILVAEGEENNLGAKAENERWKRWSRCGLCKQEHHGVVACALGWACWKTYVGRPEGDQDRIDAMMELAAGLSAADHNEDALSVKEAELAVQRRLGASEHNILATRANLAICYYKLGQLDEALSMQREVYAGWQNWGDGVPQDIAVCNLTEYLVAAREFEEAQSLAREKLPAIIDRHGPDDALTLEVRTWYARALFLEGEDLSEAERVLEDVLRRSRRVLGEAHPDTERAREFLEEVRSARADAAEES
jgi:tetratricopeptide (TPR) repeat protein